MHHNATSIEESRGGPDSGNALQGGKKRRTGVWGQDERKRNISGVGQKN